MPHSITLRNQTPEFFSVKIDFKIIRYYESTGNKAFISAKLVSKILKTGLMDASRVVLSTTAIGNQL
jgi:hypothetical protein